MAYICPECEIGTCVEVDDGYECDDCGAFFTESEMDNLVDMEEDYIEED